VPFRHSVYFARRGSNSDCQDSAPATVAQVGTDRVHRVTVRGQFAGLTDEAMRYLVRAQPDHDIFQSAYTPEGTFTYDDRILFFNLRYEVRCAGDHAAATASATGLREAESFLRTMNFGYKNLKVDVVDVSEVWEGVSRRVARPTVEARDELLHRDRHQ